MYPAGTEVIPCDDYVLTVVFENRERVHLDIKPIIDFGVFEKIKDPNAFRQVKVSFDTAEWNCGVDLDPEYIYTKCTKSDLS
jgi:hypothetical protein